MNGHRHGNCEWDRMSSNGERAIGREHLPIPYPTWVGVTTGDAKDPDTTG